VSSPDVDTKPQKTIEVAILVGCVLAFLGVSALVRWPEGSPKKFSPEGIGVFVSAGLTLIMYSFLYRDNPLFKIAENLYVGVALGYTAVVDWYQALKVEIYDPLFAAPTREAMLQALASRLVPIVLGALLLAQLTRRYSWLSRYTYALIIGWSAGIGIPVTAHTYILEQLHSALTPFGGGFWPVVGGITVLVGMVSVLFYFFFSIEHKGPAQAVSRLGVWFLMVSFGASFGYTVMGRISLFIGRAQFLLSQWLGISL
jgi:hypothetical protein